MPAWIPCCHFYWALEYLDELIFFFKLHSFIYYKELKILSDSML